MNYQQILQKAISYIEDNLHEPLTLESVAFYTGFSKYHFLRIFRKETGMTVGDYVRIMNSIIDKNGGKKMKQQQK